MSRILITGAGGNVGRALLAALRGHDVLATDLNPVPDVAFARMDVTGEDPGRVIGDFRPEVVVHLASIVTPPRGSTRDLEWRVDVQGSRNVLEACLRHGVRRLVVTSSGAAYGYHADNPVPLSEAAPLRGNPEFAYADHKRQVEESLARARADHPALEQVVLRVGTVLGEGVENQITALFRRPRLLAVAGSDSPFVFIHTDDLAAILIRAAGDGPAGIFNVAGDGAMTVGDLARALGKPMLTVPPALLRAALAVARPLGLSRYGPEQVRFLQYRPVLDNTALKERFGYTPALTSAQVFAHWQAWAGP
tara:strand:+ start:2202 stop:3122 length:921 start_codon:yes stop_codon:yes gene_type:complete